MKILHLIAQYPDRTGSGIYCKNIIHSLGQRESYRQAVLYGRNKEQARPVFFKEGEVSFSLEEYPLVFDGGDLAFPLPGMSDIMPYKSSVYKEMTEGQFAEYKALFRRRIKQAVEEVQPDILLVHHLWILASLALEQNLPTIAICHGTDIRQAKQNPQLFTRHVQGLEKLSAVVALTKEQKEEIQAIYGIAKERIRVGGGAYDPCIFFADESYKQVDEKDIRASLEIEVPENPTSAGETGRKKKTGQADRTQKTIDFVYIGKISAAKGSPELIEAFRGLDQEDARLFILGAVDESLTDEYEKAVAGDGRIYTYLPKSQEEMAFLMRQKDIFVFPSYYEGLGLVAIEAMAQGLRLVVNDLPALRSFLGPEIWQNEDISVVDMPKLLQLDDIDPAEREDYILRLRQAMAHQYERVKHTKEKSSLLSACKDFTWDGLAARIEELAGEVLSAFRKA